MSSAYSDESYDSGFDSIPLWTFKTEPRKIKLPNAMPMVTTSPQCHPETLSDGISRDEVVPSKRSINVGPGKRSIPGAVGGAGFRGIWTSICLEAALRSEQKASQSWKKRWTQR